MQPQVPVLVPVAADLLKAFKPIALRVRKTGNECRALAPIVDYVRREHDYKAGRKAREKARPKHTVLRQNHGDVALQHTEMRIPIAAVCRASNRPNGAVGAVPQRAPDCGQGTQPKAHPSAGKPHLA